MLPEIGCFRRHCILCGGPIIHRRKSAWMRFDSNGLLIKKQGPPLNKAGVPSASTEPSTAKPFIAEGDSPPIG